MNRKDCGGLHDGVECGYAGLGYADTAAMALTMLTLAEREGLRFLLNLPAVCASR